jgi:hypothetical protein
MEMFLAIQVVKLLQKACRSLIHFQPRRILSFGSEDPDHQRSTQFKKILLMKEYLFNQKDSLNGRGPS